MMHGIAYGPLPEWWTVWHSLGVLIVVLCIVAANLSGAPQQGE